LNTAKILVANRSSRRPRQSDLKRAISSAYYAMFHALCRTVADGMIGTAGSIRSAPAWRQAYRSVEHGFAKAQCSNGKVMTRFPQEIQDFGNLFVKLQEDRHNADYDPMSRFQRSDVVQIIAAVEETIKLYRRAPVKDRRAFAVWATMKARH
jgi:hypothetical protein